MCYSSQYQAGNMRTFKTRWFARFARREDISDEALREAIERSERGLIDADLGGGLIKLRVARPGEGRSGGYRMIVAYRTRDRAFFLLGFAKSDQENIDSEQLRTTRGIASHLLTASSDQLKVAIAEGEIQEISYDNERT
jgi:hypothetical protein